MREQSFNGLPTPSAFFAPDTFSWRTSKDSLLKEDLTSLERLPQWGTTQGGALYEQATPEHLISVRDGSRLPNLPTPTAQAAKHGATPDKTANAYGKNLWDIPHLLPTPTAWVQGEVDMEKYLARRERVKKAAKNGNGFGMPLDMAVRLIGENGNPLLEDGKPSDK